MHAAAGLIFARWAGKANLVIDINSGLEAVLLQLLLSECETQILSLARLHEVRPKTFSPTQVVSMSAQQLLTEKSLRRLRSCSIVAQSSIIKEHASFGAALSPHQVQTALPGRCLLHSEIQSEQAPQSSQRTQIQLWICGILLNILAPQCLRVSRSTINDHPSWGLCY